MNSTNTIYTIGHSTHSIDKFLEMLNSFQIQLLADIRTFPASRRFPHFNKDALSAALAIHRIGYRHFPGLGGRKKPLPGSINTAWRVAGFRGYADHMQTSEFKSEASLLEDLAREKTTAYMCSESVWWSCHRSLLSDYYKNRGWKVLHIMVASKAEEHPYTKPARIVNGRLSYSDQDLFTGA